MSPRKPTDPVDTTSRVTVVGAVNIDIVIAANRLPAPGETVVGPTVARHGGGKGANAAVAAAAHGARTTLVGAVGDDPDGQFATDDLRHRGLNLDSLTVRTGEPTGTALIVVDSRGENQIAVALGANAALAADHVAAAVEQSRPRCVLVSTEIPAGCVVAAVEAAYRLRTCCVLNPAPVVPVITQLLRGAGAPVILTPNAREASDLARLLGFPDPDLDAIARRLAERTGGPVVITLGADGAIVMRPGDRPRRMPAVAVDHVVDTTGAGDCFNGTLAAELARGRPLTDAVAGGMRAASRSVRYVGARPPAR